MRSRQKYFVPTRGLARVRRWGAWTESRARQLALSGQLLTLCEVKSQREFRDHA
jgi:hypothetical protein